MPNVCENINPVVCPNCRFACSVYCSCCEQYISKEPIGEHPALQPKGPRAIIDCMVHPGYQKGRAVYWLWVNHIKDVPPGYDPQTDHQCHADMLLEILKANPVAAKLAAETFMKGVQS